MQDFRILHKSRMVPGNSLKIIHWVNLEPDDFHRRMDSGMYVDIFCDDPGLIALTDAPSDW